jgi:hypothetical protein
MDRVVRIVLSVLVCNLLAGTAFASERVNDAEHGLSLVVPDGFVDLPSAMGPRTLHAYQRGNPTEGSFAMVELRSLGGTIGREPIDRAMVENAANQAARAQGAEISGFDYRKTKWKSFDLDLMVVWMGAGEDKVVTLAAQVPLAKQAVQVQIVGPATEEARIRQDLDAFLAGLDGKSNWLSEDERGEKISRLIGTAVGVLLGLGIVVWWKRRKRPA